MDEAEALADRVIIIDHGRKVAEGTPAELMDDNRGAQLTFETDHEVDLAALPLKVVAQRPLHYALADAPTPATIAALTAALADQGVLLRRLDAAHATLEDVFLELTGRELRS